MRRLWTASALLLTLLAATLANAWYADRLAGEVAGRLEQAQRLAEAGSWEEAVALTRRAFGRWEENRGYVYTFLQHKDADEILRAFRSVEEYAELRELDQYAATNADLVAQLELLAEMEQPSWLNVF